MRQKIKKECKNCGKTFITFDESVEFCNLGCKEDYKNPDVARNEQNKPLRKCKICGAEFAVSRQNRLYCSFACARQAWKDCYKEFKTEKKPKKRFCLKCKTEMTEEEYTEHRICRKCRMNSIKIHLKKLNHKEKEKPVWTCARCGCQIPDGRHKLCNECKDKIKAEKAENRQRTFKPKKCVLCSSEFVPIGPRQRYCFYCGSNMPHMKRIKIIKENIVMTKEIKNKEKNVEEPTRNPVTHNYVDLRIDYENQLEQLKNARNDCIEQKKKSEEIIAWLTPKIELLDDVIDQMKKCEANA